MVVCHADAVGRLQSILCNGDLQRLTVPEMGDQRTYRKRIEDTTVDTNGDLMLLLLPEIVRSRRLLYCYRKSFDRAGYCTHS